MFVEFWRTLETPKKFGVYRFLEIQGVGQTTSFLGDSAAAKAAASRIFAIVDRKPAINSADESGGRLATVKGRIELRYCILVSNLRVLFRLPSPLSVRL